MTYALHEAVRNNDLTEVKLLLARKKIDINQPIHGIMPIDFAALYGFLEVFILLKNHRSKINDMTLISAARGGNVAIMAILLKLDCLNRAKFVNLNNLMFAAACYGQIPMMEFLNQQGSPYDVYDKNGTPLMHAAAMRGQIKAMEFLNSKGISYYLKNSQDETPMDIAIKNANMELIKFLNKKMLKPLQETVNTFASKEAQQNEKIQSLTAEIQKLTQTNEVLEEQIKYFVKEKEFRARQQNNHPHPGPGATFSLQEGEGKKSELEVESDNKRPRWF